MTASNNYSFLQPFTLPRGQELKNRVFLAPMTNFASKPDGEVSDEEIAYYERRSGGASVVVTACANVTETAKGLKMKSASTMMISFLDLQDLLMLSKRKAPKRFCRFFMEEECARLSLFLIICRSAQAR